MSDKFFLAALAFAVIGMWCNTGAAAVIPIVSATGHHQGDSAPPGGGSITAAVNLAGITAGDINDPTTWTHSNAWQDDWQGQQINTLTSNVGWMVADLGASVTTLESLYLWNVNDPGGGDRGVAQFNVYYSDAPTVNPPPVSTTAQDYSFSSGGWTKLNPIPLYLGKGREIAGAGFDGVFDIGAVGSAQYVGLEFVGHYGASINRVGLAEVAFTDTPHAGAPRADVIDTMVLPIADIFGHQQGDSLDGNGSRLTVINRDGVNYQGAPQDPAQWTHTNTWQTDWQGSFPGGDPAGADQGWAVIDLGILPEYMVLDELFLWNVNEGGGLDRGVHEFDIYYADSPTVTPPVNTGFEAYDFASGGWTKLGDTQTLAQGTGAGALGVSGIFDIGEAGNARYLGIDMLSNYGSTFRIGLAEIAVTAIPEPGMFGLLAFGLLAWVGLDRRPKRRR